MIPIQNNFIKNDVEPIIDHPLSHLISKIVSEAVKIFATKMFLEFICRNILKPSPKIWREVTFSIVYAPILEEIIFRCVFQGGIFLMQRRWNDLNKQVLSEKDKKMQQRFRIFLAAFIFGAAHVFNEKTAILRVTGMFSSFLGGICYGYLVEKYRTLSISIFVHGLHNSLKYASILYPSKSTLFLLAIIVNRVCAFILGTT
jgi:Type II CAAX prenyl endopeptidase Rce1-like